MHHVCFCRRVAESTETFGPPDLATQAYWRQYWPPDAWQFFYPTARHRPHRKDDFLRHEMWRGSGALPRGSVIKELVTLCLVVLFAML
jgi:hypothetical protein